MTHNVPTLPVESACQGRTGRSYRRVGPMFMDTKTGTGETFLSVNLDFPVALSGAGRLPAKGPRAQEEDE